MFSSLRAETDLYSHYEDAFIPSCEKVLSVCIHLFGTSNNESIGSKSREDTGLSHS